MNNAVRSRFLRRIVMGTLVVATAVSGLAVGGVANAAAPGYRAVGVTADGSGYAAINSAGQVYAFGSVGHRGNPTGFSGEITGLSVAADGGGYAAVSSAGQVYAYGSVAHRGNPAGSSGIVGIAVTRDGSGYAAISNSGQVYAYGTVQYRGNPTGFTGGITGISVTADGGGYAALSGSGQVYAYGTVQYRGNADAATAGGSTVSSRIVSIAQRESRDTARNKEVGGANCNFYTGRMRAGEGNACGGQGWRSQKWCADFAGWVWREAGARTTTLTAAASSFRTYGERNGTWHAGNRFDGAKPGDAIVFGGEGHVGIVTEVRSDAVTMISGNSSDQVRATTVVRGDSTVVGYSSPVS